MKTAILEPDWPTMARFFADGLRTHSFKKNAVGPVISLIETVRFLAVEQPEEVDLLLEELNRGEK